MPDFLHGLLPFVAYFVAAVSFCVLFSATYTRLTPHNEFKLIVEQHNASAAIALGGALVGFAIALAGAVHATASLLEFAIWGVVAFAAQLVAYFLARLAHPSLSPAIENNAIAAAVWLAAVSIAAGLLTAACMSS